MAPATRITNTPTPRRGRHRAAGRRSDRAAEEASRAGSRFDAVARWTYETGGSAPWLSALLGMGSLSDVAEGAGLLSEVAGNTSHVVDASVRTRARAAQAEADRRSAELGVTATLEGLHRSGTEMRAAIADQRRLIDQLERQLDRQVALAVIERAAPPPTDLRPPPPQAPPRQSQSEMDALIVSIWGPGPDGVAAQCIADHESGDNPNDRNAESGAAGLFQMMPFWWDGNNEYGWRFDPYDPRANAIHAHLLWRRQGWDPWTTKHWCV